MRLSLQEKITHFSCKTKAKEAGPADQNPSAVRWYIYRRTADGFLLCRNCLKIAGIDGTYVVAAFDTGVLGRSYSFAMTKNVRNKILRASAGPSIAVPVSTAAGF